MGIVEKKIRLEKKKVWAVKCDARKIRYFVNLVKIIVKNILI